MNAAVSSLFIYPDSQAPGQELDSVEITPDGPSGNRAKKNAVHLVAASDYVRTHPKANVVLDMEPEVLAGLVGRTVRLGEATLRITRTPSRCDGVYADVVEPGRLAVEDLLLVAQPE